MALTKTQINYLENKLERVAQEKIQEFKQQFTPDNSLSHEIAEQIIKGKVKLISTSAIKDLVKNSIQNSNGYWYSFSISIEKLISEEDKEKIEAIRNANADKVNEYTDKVRTVKQNALDKIVLEGVDFETAIKELSKI